MPMNLVWDKTGEHFYHTGIDRVALYLYNKVAKKYGKPVAWNGVTAVNENPSGAESTKIYADNINYLTLISKEEFGLTLEAYQSPEEFDLCDGTAALGGMKIHGVSRLAFGLVYRTLVGNDVDEAGSGQNYIYHIVYGCKAAPSSRDNATVNDSPEAQSLSWEISTTPITDFGAIASRLSALGVKEIAHIEIDCSKLTQAQLSALEADLFDTSKDMPTPAVILADVGQVTRLATPTLALSGETLTASSTDSANVDKYIFYASEDDGASFHVLANSAYAVLSGLDDLIPSGVADTQIYVVTTGDGYVDSVPSEVVHYQQ